MVTLKERFTWRLDGDGEEAVELKVGGFTLSSVELCLLDAEQWRRRQRFL